MEEKVSENQELGDLLVKLFTSQRFAVLATQEGGQPYLSLMAFAASDDLKYLLFASRRGTRKYANLASEPRAAMLVDNRTNQAADTEGALAVTATGRAEEAGPGDSASWMRVFLARHPTLLDFLELPDCALMRLKVEKYYLVSRFQEVRVLSMIP
jgi:hypothetical protein